MKKLISMLLLLATTYSSAALSETTIRLAVLAFGTVNWELQTMQEYGLDKHNDIRLEIRPVANAQAAKIALQSGATDMIVGDFIWVSSQRERKIDLVFAPYSTTAGALMLQPGSKAGNIDDLVGMRLGIAGGGLDKNWILLKALARGQGIENFDQKVTKSFGAPPLLSQQLERGQLDALLNYWHFAARLEAKGYTRMLDGHDLLERLGINARLPTLGYIFSEKWGNQHADAVRHFLAMSVEAKNLLCESDPAWESIRPLTKAGDEKTATILRKRYCEGRIRQWGPEEKQAAEQLIPLLHANGDSRLTGESGQLQPGTFWQGYPLEIDHATNGKTNN